MSGRLTFALGCGAVSLPAAGPVVVVGPPADYDLSALPPDRAFIVQGFRPDHDAWQTRGYQVAPYWPDTASAALVCLPRARAAAKAAIAAAASLVPGRGPVLVDGAKDQGIDAILKALRRVADVEPAVSKAHGKIFSFAATVLPDDWHGRDTAISDGFVTAPGAFSADGVDPGSAALAAALPPGLKGRAADLGAGWGYLSAMLLRQDGIRSVDLIEADHAALEAARKNLNDPRAAFFWADATAFVPEDRYDLIVSNPPFHRGRRADPALGRQFIAAAARLLRPRGAFFMVANRHLPYEAALTEAFGEVTELPGPAAFKLLRASRPRARRENRLA